MKKIKAVLVSFLMLGALFLLAGCSDSLSGSTFDSYCGLSSLYFTGSNAVRLEQEDGGFFNGTYEYNDGRFFITIQGQGMFPTTNFIAHRDGRDLRLNGGIASVDHLFIRR